MDGFRSNFDLESPLVCEGLIGDGCGGGRFFFVEDDSLYVYDPMSKQSKLLFEGIKEAENISKSGCIIKIKCKRDIIKFDLKTVSEA